MRVTVMVDASFCPQTQVAGYGYWVAAERGRGGGSGTMRETVTNATAAEMQAVCNAIHQGMQKGLIQQGDDILVQSDCMGAIVVFQNALKDKHDDHMRQAHQALWGMAEKYQLGVVFKHVKGHTGTQDRRSKSNRHCDIAARQAMRAARDAKRKEELKR